MVAVSPFLLSYHLAASVVVVDWEAKTTLILGRLQGCMLQM